MVQVEEVCVAELNPQAGAPVHGEHQDCSVELGLIMPAALGLAGYGSAAGEGFGGELGRPEGVPGAAIVSGTAVLLGLGRAQQPPDRRAVPGRFGRCGSG